MENVTRNALNRALVQKLVEDNNYKSRKLLYGVLTSCLIASLAVVSVWIPALVAALDVTVGGLVAVYAIYCGANVGNKFNVGKSASSFVATTEEAEVTPPAKTAKKVVPPPESQSLGD